MLSQLERSLIEGVAKLAPWLAPAPSAFFVARSSERHLAVPDWMAIVIALVIEALGISTVHNALWMSDWNQNKRKSDPVAPTWIAVLLGGIYFLATISLTIVLETLPDLAIYAPALFPLLAIVGAVNLGLVARQRRRELNVERERKERSKARSRQRPTGVQEAVHAGDGNGHKADQYPSDGRGVSSIARARQVRELTRAQAQRMRMDIILDVITEQNGELSVTQLAKDLGASRTTIYNDLDRLRRAGEIAEVDGRMIALRSNGHRRVPAQLS